MELSVDEITLDAIIEDLTDGIWVPDTATGFVKCIFETLKTKVRHVKPSVIHSHIQSQSYVRFLNRPRIGMW